MRIDQIKTLTPGTKVQYSDIANQNCPVLTILATPGTFTPRNEWATNEFFLIDEATLDLDWSPLNAYGWKIVEA